MMCNGSRRFEVYIMLIQYVGSAPYFSKSISFYMFHMATFTSAIQVLISDEEWQVSPYFVSPSHLFMLNYRLSVTMDEESPLITKV